MHEALFRVAGAGAYARATDGTDLRVELWCDDHCDLLCVRGTDPERILDRVRSVVDLRESVSGERELVAVTADCLAEHERTVDPYLSRHGCVLVPPIVYADGAKRIRVLALTGEALAEAYRELHEEFDVDVEAKREVDSVRAPGRIAEGPDLSPRQRQVLELAHGMGYYQIPRETDMEAIAAEVGIDRRTAEHHRRKAERKVMDAFTTGPFR